MKGIRTQTLTVWCTPQQNKVMDAHAKANGLTRAGMARKLMNAGFVALQIGTRP